MVVQFREDDRTAVSALVGDLDHGPSQVYRITDHGPERIDSLGYIDGQNASEDTGLA